MSVGTAYGAVVNIIKSGVGKLPAICYDDKDVNYK